MTEEQSTRGVYACGLCKAAYSRGDQLIRHVRSHTRQRPFVCSVCAKGFGRQDLLKRHMGTHNGRNMRNADLAGATGPSMGHQSHRVQQACRTCAEKKLKCTEDKPCGRCEEKHIECVLEFGDQSQEKSRNVSESPMVNPLGHGASASQREDNNHLDDDEMSTIQVSREYFAAADSTLAMAFPGNEDSILQQEPMVQDILGGFMPFPASGDSLQFDQDSTFEAMDFFFLEDPSAPELTAPAPLSPGTTTSPQQSTISLGAEAYQVSGAFSTWIPRKNDGHDLDEQDLVLQHSVSQPSQDVKSSEGLKVLKKDLSPMLRDELLAMVLGHTSKVASRRIIRSFPPVETLRDLIHVALVHTRERQIGHFIHLSSFDLNKQRPELLGALVAYGAIVSSSLEARKFGYALQETIRMAINQLVGLPLLLVPNDAETV